ncbi:MAG: glucose-6-phosphate 1-epimerase [Planctomycetota bacterium]|jgi:glucose-6-phosphate 1-epimerase
MTRIDALNEAFGIEGALTFGRGGGGLPLARVSTTRCHAEIYLHGAHVTSWYPTGQQEVLWVSSTSSYDSDRAIRGGVPICWPWFGDHPEGAGRPAHGFARTSEFTVADTACDADGNCTMEFRLEPDERSRSLWPTDFGLSLHARFGSELDLQLCMRNDSGSVVEHSSALHTYLRVGNVEGVELQGFAGHDYLDKLRGFERHHQAQEPRIEKRTDRVYVDSTNECRLIDPEWNREITVAKTGSRATVLWNPGREIAASMSDFDDDGYRTMLCIESANTADDLITLNPGQEHRIGTTLRVGPLRSD